MATATTCASDNLRLFNVVMLAVRQINGCFRAKPQDVAEYINYYYCIKMSDKELCDYVQQALKQAACIGYLECCHNEYWVAGLEVKSGCMVLPCGGPSRKLVPPCPPICKPPEEKKACPPPPCPPRRPCPPSCPPRCNDINPRKGNQGCGGNRNNKFAGDEYNYAKSALKAVKPRPPSVVPEVLAKNLMKRSSILPIPPPPARTECKLKKSDHPKLAVLNTHKIMKKSMLLAKHIKK